MEYTRRELGKMALALPAASLIPLRAKPNSKFNGVQIGLNVPYSFGNNLMPADETLRSCVQLGVSAVELRSQPVEAFMGVPTELLRRASQKADVEKLAQPRLSAPLDKAKALRKQWDDAGVKIEILKFDGIYNMSDEVLDYAFALARAVGARAISCEISHELPNTERVGKFADKHGLMVGYHGHTETAPEHWKAAFAQAKHNGANVDIGHFIAGTNTSPVPFITEFHDRITHLHVKDRKKNNGANVPFGEGDTPVKEVLQLLREKKWNIQATIEYEYPVPSGSDRMAEIGKCVQFCKAALST
jgi:sugar phosphate isomerase/epimerase